MNIEFVSKDDNYSSTYYRFEIKDYQTPTEDRYAKIVNVSIKGESMCFINKSYNNQIYIELYDDALNPEDFVFESIGLSEYRKSSWGAGISNILKVFGIGFLVTLGLVALSGIIFVSIFFSIRHVRRVKDDDSLPPPANG